LIFLLFVLLPAVLGSLPAGWAAYRLTRRHLDDARHAKCFAAAAGLALALGRYLTTFIAAAGVIGAILAHRS
jgi:uncharacterized membrane protein YesL